MKQSSFGIVVAGLALCLSAGGVHAQSKSKKERVAAAKEAMLPKASDEQIEALSKADVGDYTCEFNARLSVKEHPKFPGYALLTQGKNQYIMRPVVSHTGAIRLEDMRGRTLMIQIATKAMLMDTKLGQRLADGCLRAGDENRAQPASEGLGINAKTGG